MKIRTRLAVQFTLIVACLLVAFAFVIYFFSSSYRQGKFYERLDEKARDYAKLLAEVDEIKPGIVKIFDKNTAYLPEERILVYNELDQQLFNTKEDTLRVSAALLNLIRTEKELRYEENGKEILGKLCTEKNKKLVVLVSAIDKDGMSKLDNLKVILLVGLLLCTLVTMFAGWLFAKQALNPISNVVAQADKITASNLTQRINEGKGQDEIAQLSSTFNGMLERIEMAFVLQKSFVSNSSHELRTPLTSITGQLEVVLMNERAPEEYKQVLLSILEDIRSLNQLANGLLEMTQADMDISSIEIKKTRIDECIWQSRNELIKRHPDYNIHIEADSFPKEEKYLTVRGSEYLLKSVFTNLMDNACKFSYDKKVNVSFGESSNFVTILFRDKGIGITHEDLQHIQEPFFRGSNVKNIPGHGLGLSLVTKVISQHKGRLSIASQPGEYSLFTVSLPVF